MKHAQMKIECDVATIRSMANEFLSPHTNLDLCYDVILGMTLYRVEVFVWVFHKCTAIQQQKILASI